MTSLHVIFGLGPPIKNPGYAYGLALCGVLVACDSLKTIITDKLYRRIDYFCMLIHTRVQFGPLPDQTIC